MNQPIRCPGEVKATIKTLERAQSVSVVICTRNRPALLEKCLDSISRLDLTPDQVLVVDNSTGDDDTRKVAREHGARYVVESVLGLSRARNRGITECDTDVVAFLDDDVIPATNWLRVLIAPFEEPQTGATAGRVVTPESRAAGTNEQCPRAISNRDEHWFEIAAFGGLGHGANMAFRKSALPTHHFFDERLGRGAPFEIGEESYAFVRLLSCGYRVVNLPGAAVNHPPFTRSSIQHEARNSFAYWLLLFTEFPRQRMDALRFLIRRLRGEPLDWPRDPQDPGDIVSSRWHILLRAAIRGLWLFVRTPRHGGQRNRRS